MGNAATGSTIEIWGVLNVTPDSFSDGARYLEFPDALARAQQMVFEGAHVVDIGGQSSRPAGQAYGSGAALVSVEEETRRVVPVVEALRRQSRVRISVDTWRVEVAKQAIAAGADIINDVSCAADPALVQLVAQHDIDYVIMHNRNRGEVTESNTQYGNVVTDVCAELVQARRRCVEMGVNASRIWFDPGLGFAKTAKQSLSILACLAAIVELGQPVLLGASRKSFIGKVAPNPDNEAAAHERLGGSIACAIEGDRAGVHAIRVHDVQATRQALLVQRQCRAAREAAL